LQPYLKPDEQALALEEITLVVQVNGKIRARITAAPSIDEKTAFELALANESVKPHLAGKEIRKRIYVPGKLVNLVVA